MEEGLRERKKRETRQRIADIAMGLFMIKGFDNVTVAEIARTADVSVNTVFNYFGTKEDLFADRQDVAIDLAPQVLRERAPGESAVEAFRRDFFDALDTRHWRYGLNQGADVFDRIVSEAPSLVAKLREMQEKREDALTRALAGELGADADDLTPRLVATHILNTTRILTQAALRRQLAGEQWESIEPGLRAQAAVAFDLLESGIGDLLAGEGPAQQRDPEAEDEEAEHEDHQD
ncbi:TetR/AcrR family transcriptional regulator [Nonomuraea sp. NPDC050786]|uniref:TetR/AcrR family transcriptional regulator n=1 Tax=Nonomuraea sp. NPDC050786 TaxID=3154840 RepID=UPI0033F08E5C